MPTIFQEEGARHPFNALVYENLTECVTIR